MSMTREETITCLQEKYDYCKSFYDLAAHPEEDYPETAKYLQALQIALSALRPVSREQVEKVWRVCNACEIPCNNCESIYAWDRYGKPQECTGCPENGYKNYTPESQFCESCGRPLTDEAVQMVMERLEALKDGKD